MTDAEYVKSCQSDCEMAAMDAETNQADPVGTADAKAMLQADWLRLHKENKRLSEAMARPMGYATTLQRAIEYACKGKQIPESIALKCPFHAALLNNLSSRALTEKLANE